MKKQTTEQAFKSLPISYVGDNFKEWFYPMEFDPKANIKTLTSQKLPHAMNDEAILKELNPGEVSIEEIVATLKTMDHSVWALFYSKDINGVLRSVSVGWFGGGWDASAYALDGRRWCDGGCVFSRNSRDTQPLSSSDPLDLDTLTLRIEKLEDFQKSVEQILKL